MSYKRSVRLRIAVAGLACLMAIASAPLAITALGEQGLALPGLAASQRVMAILDARSPGERQKGELSQTKRKTQDLVTREAPRGASPVERLARVVVPAPLAPPVDAAPPVIGEVPPGIPELVAPAAAVAVAAAPLAVGAAIVGGSVAPPITSAALLPPPAASAVPEPQSWLMMLVGFGLVGSALRRRSPPIRARRACAG